MSRGADSKLIQEMLTLAAHVVKVDIDKLGRSFDEVLAERRRLVVERDVEAEFLC